VSSYLDEAQLEIAVCDWLTDSGLGWEYVHGPQIALDGDAPKHVDYGQVLLADQLRGTLLPKLLSDELKVPVAEKTAEEVA